MRNFRLGPAGDANADELSGRQTDIESSAGLIPADAKNSGEFEVVGCCEVLTNAAAQIMRQEK